ncbi:hypothetical protein PBI_SMARTIES_32 [Microbacterium phage Smarties]|uniref:Uncharacterized protein n=1 Tax=Microbacterium phage Ariadne TaxID=2656546 RepID=A0A649VAT2_9CAUD|nr:hypothetical protein QDA10_gp032 [Microbacterium phage Ariadne]QGJ89436.1 hypothetical protein PBI_ARIADNE_32 [Microbacterium phage Ariadne]QGJ91423.1 hypothetical protein PBI_SMARTIES_32 [Microbacterium phage Smarties]
MRDAFVNEHQDNYFDAEEAGVAAHTAQSKFASDYTADALTRDHQRHPDTAFPFSGDHLGAFSHRETTPDGDPGDEIRRERYIDSDISLWAMVAA